MSLDSFFITLVMLTVMQRVFELCRSRLNQSTLNSGGFTRIDSAGSYLAMVCVHVSWFIAMLVEHTLNPRRIPIPLAIAATAVFIGAQLLRLAVMRALGQQWNTQVMAPIEKRNDPGVVISGPYRYLRHPNYLAVILEFISFPLVGGAVITAMVFSVANALILRHRIALEERYLFSRPGYAEAFSHLPRLFPRIT